MRTAVQNRDRPPALSGRFLLIFLPLITLLVAIGVSHYYAEMRLARVSLESNEIQNVALAQKGITSEMRAVISDLTFLAKLNELWGLLDDPNNDSARQNLSQEFLYFSEKKGIYDQIRFLSADGMEIIRINYNQGQPHIVEQSQLQNKSDRYYFKEAMAQDIGGVYMSPFDLNVEDGQVENPFRPVIRFATPLFNSQGEKRGVLMFNFRGERLLQSFHLAAPNIDDHLNLINAKGYWLSGPRPEDEWGFFMGRKRSFSETFPAAWQRILNENSGSFVTKEGLFTFTTIYPMVSVMEFYANAGMGSISSIFEGYQDNEPHFWKTVSHVPTPILNATSQSFFRQNLLLYSLAGLFYWRDPLSLPRQAFASNSKRRKKALSVATVTHWKTCNCRQSPWMRKVSLLSAMIAC